MSLPARIFEAHERMLATLPVTTHSSDGLRLDLTSQQAGPRKSNSRRPIQVGEQVFRSITQAKVALRVAPTTIYKWLDCGKATYVTEKLPL